jgi:hypothetical protein
MQVTTAEEIRRASRLGQPVIAGIELVDLLVRPHWWEEGFVQLRLPAARLLARQENASRRTARLAITAGPALVGTVEPKIVPKSVRAARQRLALAPAAH